MKRERFFRLAVLSLAFALVAGLGAAAEEKAPLKENKGMKAPVITSIDLGPEIEGMQGRQLRMRMFTVDPGGVIGIHSHKDRPAAVHMLSGTVTEFREGGEVKEHKAGDSWSEGEATTHWMENRGTEPAVFFSVDIVKS
jgi:quercetin dioxygenase-like cupin family protein